MDKLEKRRNQNVSTQHGSLQNVRKIDIRRNPKSEQIKSLKALVRIDNQIFNMTIDTGSLVSFLNWATTKQFLEECPKTQFTPAENQNLVDYNKHSNLILGALKVDIRSAGWEVKGLSFLENHNQLGEPWPETELDEKVVETSIDIFHKALFCLKNRLLDMAEPVRNEYILEHSSSNTGGDDKANTSSYCCYSNQIGSKRTTIDRNENGQNSRVSNSETSTFCNFSHLNQLAKKFYKNSVKNLTMENNGNAEIDKDKVENRSGKNKVNISDIRRSGGYDQVTEEVKETTFQRTRLIKRGTGATNEDKRFTDSEIPYAEWKIMRQQIKNKDEAGTSTSASLMGKEGASASAACSEMAVDKKERSQLVSFWDLVGLERSEKPKTMFELETQTQMISPNAIETCVNQVEGMPIVEVDLTADSQDDDDHEGNVVSRRINHNFTKEERGDNDAIPGGTDNLAQLFDQTLLAELTTEDTWMDRLRRVIERNDRHSFEPMGPYTISLWNQSSLVDDRILVNDRLAVPCQLRTVVLKRIHWGHLGQEAMLNVSHYLWWPHMHKDIVNLAEEGRSCTRYGKNAKYIIPKIAAKPLPLLTQELQLDYAGPLEDLKGKKIYLLVAIDRYSKFPSVKITKLTRGKSSIKFLSTYIDTHGIPESIRTDQFSGFKGKRMKNFCSENNIEQKFCPVGDH